jgi:hypothetical protein
MEAAIAETTRTRRRRRRRSRHRRSLWYAFVHDRQAHRVLWGLAAVGFAIACALGYVKTYPLAVRTPPVIGGKAVPAQMVARRQYVADQLYALERRTLRAADHLERAPRAGHVPPRTYRELQRLHLQFGAAAERLDDAVRKRIWKALSLARTAALNDDPAKTREALRKLEVKLAVARYMH